MHNTLSCHSAAPRSPDTADFLSRQAGHQDSVVSGKDFKRLTKENDTTWHLHKSSRHDRYDKSLPVYFPDGWDTPIDDSDECEFALIRYPSLSHAQAVVEAVNHRHGNRFQHNRTKALTYMFWRTSTVRWDPEFSASIDGNLRKKPLGRIGDGIVRDAYADSDLYHRLADVKARERVAAKANNDFDPDTPEDAPEDIHASTDIGKRGKYWFDGRTIGKCNRVVPAGVTPLEERRKNRVPQYSGDPVYSDVPVSSTVSSCDSSIPFFGSVDECYVVVRKSNLESLHRAVVDEIGARGLNDHCHFVLESIGNAQGFVAKEDLDLLSPFVGHFAVEKKLQGLISDLGKKLGHAPSDTEIRDNIEFDSFAVFAAANRAFAGLVDVLDDEKPLSHAYQLHGRVVHALSSMSRDFRCLFDLENGKGELLPMVEADIPASYFQAAASLSRDGKAMQILSSSSVKDLRQMIRKRAVEVYGAKADDRNWKKNLMVGCFFNRDSNGFYSGPYFRAMEDLFPKLAAFIRRVRGNGPYGPSILSRVLTRQEGSVMRHAINTCKAENLPVISNNDGIFCTTDRVGDLRRIMENSFEFVMGYRVEIGAKKVSTTFLEWILENKKDQLPDRLVDAIEKRIQQLSPSIESARNEAEATKPDHVLAA